MLGMYVIIVTIILLIAFAGMEETMLLFAYIDLQLRFAVLRLRMKWMGWNLRRGLIKDTANYHKFIRKETNERKRSI
jgi:hypothetical protein